MKAALEQHPYNIRHPIPAETRLLIVGTAPPPRFSNPDLLCLKGVDFDFFYGSQENLMWPILEAISQRKYDKNLFTDEMSSDDCRRVACNFLQIHNLWMRDILQKYRRKDGRKESASDVDIVPVEWTDLRTVYSSPKLSVVAFTSEQAAQWTIDQLVRQGVVEADVFKQSFSAWQKVKVQKESLEIDIKKKFYSSFIKTKIGHRDVAFFVLPTPSPRSPMGLKRSDKEAIYENLLFPPHT